MKLARAVFEPMFNINFITKYFRGRISGHIDMYTGNLVAGWVKRRSDERHLTVDIYINESRVAESVVANLYRSDLEAAGYGNGTYGFELPIPALPSASGADEVKVSVVISGQNRPILVRRFPSLPLVLSDYSSNTTDVFTSSAETEPLTYRCRIDSVSPSEIKGWAVEIGRPDAIFDIDILIDGFFFKRIKNDQVRNDLRAKNISDGLGGFISKLPLAMFEQGRHSASLRLPDGSMQTRDVDITPDQSSASDGFIFGNKSKIGIIIPVFNAYDDVVTCVERLKLYTPPDINILFINDASTDSRVADFLCEDNISSNMSVLVNKSNLGFTRTVNRGIAALPDHDVIILNSDARVTPGWVEGLRIAAQSAPKIATVTAMSDRAGAFSAPNIGNENDLPDGVDEATFARSFRRRSLGLYPVVPTGNGFCMYISRACLDEIGALDAEAFPRGYGEENDFCMRARRAGWHNIIDDRTYVFHDRSKSFGAAKGELMAAGRAVIDARYPDYKHAIRVFSSCDKIATGRLRARQALQDCIENPKMLPRVLFVTSTQTGGTPQTNRDLMQALSEAVDCWNLRCDSKVLELTRVVGDQIDLVCRHELTVEVDPLTHHSREYDSVVIEWLLRFDFDLVHIRHLAWHSISLPRLIKSLNRKIIVSFHDFYMVSPTINLIDDAGIFLGNEFYPEGSRFRASLWAADSQPTPTGAWLQFWQERFQAELLLCDAFVTTSPSARDLILKTFSAIPSDRFVVIPHGRDFTDFYSHREFSQHGNPIKILVPGNINLAKGLDIICSLAERDHEKLLEFHILGKISSQDLKSNSRIVCHGGYERRDFIKKVQAIRPNVGAVFSICNETYCHTLTELWSAGLPVMVFDFPTVANRVRESGAGWVLDHRDISALYERILQIGYSRQEQEAAYSAVAAWQAGLGVGATTRVMAADYLAVYRDLLRKKEGPPGSGTVATVGVVCPGAVNLKDGNASTHIRVWERTQNDIDRDLTYVRMTPQTLLANCRRKVVDAVIIQRTAIPRTMVSELLSVLNEGAIPYIFELDDDLLNVPSEKDPRGTYAAYAKSLRDLIAQASAVTVSTDTLQRSIEAINSNVFLLPNRLSDRLWKSPPLERLSDGFVRALYMGTVTHHEDLQLVFPALEAVAAANPTFRITVVGGTADVIVTPERAQWLTHIAVPDFAKNYDAFVPWLRSQAAACDFSIAPLADTPFNASKSALKVLDYAALGLPILASDVNVYRGLVKAAPAAKLVPNTTQKWQAAIARQISLGETSRKQGAENRQWVLKNHMLNTSLAEFDRLILDLIESSVKKGSQ